MWWYGKSPIKKHASDSYIKGRYVAMHTYYDCRVKFKFRLFDYINIIHYNIRTILAFEWVFIHLCTYFHPLTISTSVKCLHIGVQNSTSELAFLSKLSLHNKVNDQITWTSVLINSNPFMDHGHITFSNELPVLQLLMDKNK
jgi:hypothetical protein